MRGIHSYFRHSAGAAAAAAAAAATLLIAACGTTVSQAGSSSGLQFGPGAGAKPGTSATPGPAATPGASDISGLGHDLVRPCAGGKSGTAPGPAALPASYHVAGNPATQVCAALAAAQAGHQEVLLDFGANWCVDCRVLMKLFRSPAVSPLLRRDYRIVSVDVGHGQLNAAFTSHYVNLTTSGLPALAVLTPNGNIRVATNDGKFEDAHTMSPAQVRAFLTRWAPAAATLSAGSYQGGGVQVTASLVAAAQGDQVRVTFTPQKPGFHLYSTGLSARQSHGLGIATRVGVRGALTAAGPAIASQPVRMLRIAMLNATLPVFPDGPVTVSVPVRAAGPGPAGVIVSYAACSSSVCNLPVIGHRISLQVT